ncbi:hypothetical protein J8J04_02530 ['Fragaria x ananassa' phyllody phytoplasma]|uniref:Uncharacterized protein n=1 Tax='Fragaria x ananassa' phyllody phytoplasma TaxID=2358428 RepID=A0ABS5K3S8_9MOLU|nr:hypothetical protein ['Fragaria x ananassa' phyllody phytoplasma]MBS2126552.1 hypothetical protein ['Fragaria x ananassa' phyllody phytoplasma]
MECRRKIADLEVDKTYYENTLKRAEEFKKDLERDYNKTLLEDKQSTLSSLNSLYEITSSEG